MHPARIVFVGDLHLGRRPSALPNDLDTTGLRPADLGPAEVWRRTVALALADRAHAVVLAGDVVDREDDRFGAGRVLRSGIEALVAAKIPVFAVVGNHDVKALPRVADAIADFRLLGRRGEWESVRVAPDGATPFQLVGWSFPKKQVRTSPLPSLDRSVVDRGIATLGVLHCDLDAGASPYAPVRTNELEETGFDAWLLGHVHKPSDLATRAIGYLGSMTGLDPGEPGAHGPWWIEVDGPGRVRVKHVPLAPIRYEAVECPLRGIVATSRDDTADDLDGRIRRALSELQQRLEAEDAIGADRAALVVCRVRVRGDERHSPAVRRVLADERFIATHVVGETHFAVERIVEDARPDLQLEKIAESPDAPGILARRLIELRDGGEGARAFIARAEAAFETEVGGARFALLAPPPWRAEARDEGALIELLLHVGTRELEGLLAQRAAVAASAEAGS